MINKKLISIAGLLALLLASLAHPAAAQAPLRKDLRKDFGAVGDGRTNDQGAFEKAAAFFNQRAQTPAGAAPAILFIPKGVYLVGRQPADGADGLDVLRLVGCRNLSIQGVDSASTEIRYAAGLRYGAFEPGSHRPYEAATAFFTDRKYAAIVGVCVLLYDCDNVTVSGLTLNGNVTQALIGGHWGDTGIQLNYDGIGVGNSRRITLRALALHHFGRDGIQVGNHLAKSLDDPARDNIVLDGVSCRYNGRQGFSLTGANGLRATNCDFSHTGRVVVPSLGKALFSNPGAGVDVEPEGGFAANVRFDNCRLVDNAGQGLVSDRPGNSHTTKNIVLNNCLLWGTTNWSAWVTQLDFLFINCRIYGSFIHGCRAENPAEATRFVGCTFEDRPYHGQPAYGPDLLHTDGSARYMSFTDCRFVGTHGYLTWVIVGKADTASYFHLRRCTFVYDYAQPTQGAYDNLQGAIFTGPNAFRDGPRRTSLHRTGVTLGNGGASQSTVVRAPGSLQLLAANCQYRVVAGLDVGRAPAHSRDSASVVIGKGNNLLIDDLGYAVAELYIGPTARVVVRKGAGLELARHTRLVVAGQLVVEDGAYFFRDPQAELQLVGKGQLRISPQALKAKPATL